MSLTTKFAQAGVNVDEIAARAEVEDILAEFGYAGLEFTPVNGEFAASATKTVSTNQYRAQALGRTREIAARTLVATITRR